MISPVKKLQKFFVATLVHNVLLYEFYCNYETFPLLKLITDSAIKTMCKGLKYSFTILMIRLFMKTVNLIKRVKTKLFKIILLVS